jgi:hypothetical protein
MLKYKSFEKFKENIKNIEIIQIELDLTLYVNGVNLKKNTLNIHNDNYKYLKVNIISNDYNKIINIPVLKLQELFNSKLYNKIYKILIENKTISLDSIKTINDEKVTNEEEILEIFKKTSKLKILSLEKIKSDLDKLKDILNKDISYFKKDELSNKTEIKSIDEFSIKKINQIKNSKLNNGNNYKKLKTIITKMIDPELFKEILIVELNENPNFLNSNNKLWDHVENTKNKKYKEIIIEEKKNKNMELIFIKLEELIKENKKGNLKKVEYILNQNKDFSLDLEINNISIKGLIMSLELTDYFDLIYKNEEELDNGINFN